MPFDVAAAVIANTALSHDYNVLALAAPEIAAATAPGQFLDAAATLHDFVRNAGQRPANPIAIEHYGHADTCLSHPGIRSRRTLARVSGVERWSGRPGPGF